MRPGISASSGAWLTCRPAKPSSGVRTTCIAEWSSSDVWPEDAAQWDHWSFDPVARAVWRSVGVTDAREADAWRSAVGEPAGCVAWVRAGCLDPAGATRWISSGFTAVQAKNWLQMGVTDSRIAERIRGHLRLDFVAALLDAGFKEFEIAVWADRRFSMAALEPTAAVAVTHPTALER